MTTSAPIQFTPPPPAHHRGPGRRTALAAGAAVLVVAGTTVGIVLARDQGPTPAPSPGTASSATVGPTATTGPSGGSVIPSASPTSPSPAPSVPSTAFRFQPLWPFGSVRQAALWQHDTKLSGSQPWRLDPGATALAFATQHLGYTELNRVTSTWVVGDEAWIGVAGTPPEGSTAAAVLHLARIGAGSLVTRPWEVVGSQDTLLTLTMPRYGSTVGTSFTVGGRITGVDESLVIQVRDRTGRRLARVGGLPAGGERTPWQATISLPTTTSGLVTVAVSTGGHVAEVEKFAITAVRITPGASTTDSATAHDALAAITVNGHYVGDCATADATGVTDPVCSRLVASSGSRYLYRLGYQNTDVGCFVILSTTQSGRWRVEEECLGGQDVPADLGGPIATP